MIFAQSQCSMQNPSFFTTESIVCTQSSSICTVTMFNANRSPPSPQRPALRHQAPPPPQPALALAPAPAPPPRLGLRRSALRVPQHAFLTAAGRTRGSGAVRLIDKIGQRPVEKQSKVSRKSAESRTSRAVKRGDHPRRARRRDIDPDARQALR